jgi:hypothetical protein
MRRKLLKLNDLSKNGRSKGLNRCIPKKPIGAEF